jgi:DNA (cytosine-5)-methyltransferase 1
LTRKACLGILRRADERGKELPPQLQAALMAQAGVDSAKSSGSDQMQIFLMEAPVAFAANQRDEVRNLHDIAGALGARPGMKQQTFVAHSCLTPWDTQQARVFTPEGTAPTLAGADGGGGRNPGGVLFTAGFCAGAAPTAGGIGYQEDCSPTLKAAESGTNMVPSVLCLNDQGGSVIDYSENVTGTLRAQEHGHQPLVYENHGIDARYTGPHAVAPTMSARYGTGGNNVPLVAQENDPVICIAGNAIDRQPQNGGNGIGCQKGIAYTLTATDHHAVFSRQRTDAFKNDEIVSTQSARQYKDATDLICRTTTENETASTFLIRRLTPLECERLQGFPDGWTDIPGASDSARYKALGNSVAIPCVEYIMRGIGMAAK